MQEIPCIPITELMNGGNKIILLHDKKQYQLSITRRGKLILTIAEVKIKTSKNK